VARRAPAAPRATLPETLIVQVTGTDRDGDAIARPAVWQGKTPPPQILMLPEARGQPALAPGERVLARLRPVGFGRYEGRTLRRVDDTPGQIVGVYQPNPGRPGGRLVPTDRRAKAEWVVPPGQEAGAQAGEIVAATPLPAHGLGPKPARITERLGRMGDARAISLIVIHTHDIPTVFPVEALDEAERAAAVAADGRVDLRDTRLVTIDGEDARDFDDAVFAEPEADGFRLLVAIADVAHYVRPGSALDREAEKRGNSCYFPDRVVPMLPEPLSNGWCSLKPDEDRGVVFCDIRIDRTGEKRSHRFGRGLMRSQQRLTYTQVQDEHAATGAHANLYAAFDALLAARQRRGTLDLDLPERKVDLDEDGRVVSVSPRPRLDSHRLIEEFMVLANVCAAEELERFGRPCIYRVHTPPSDEKLEALREFLKPFGVTLPQGRTIRPGDLDRVLQRVAGSDVAPLVNEVVLRSQSQAAYSPDNIGHFGLALPRYAHFTSPIRRYADLLVHRALIAALRLGAGGLPEGEAESFPAIAEHITATERRAALAERDTMDRYLAAFMEHQVGLVFRGRVSGVGRFGIFVTIAETGASGLVPMSMLPDDFWMFDEATQSLSGRRSGKIFRLAQEVEVRLAEADPITGSLVFQIVTPERTPAARRDRRHARPP
jgi:ribonuclease R